MEKSNHAPLPKATQDYIANGAPRGQRNQALFAAAIQFRDARYTYEEAESILFQRALADGLSGAEAYDTIKSAYSKGSRDPVGGSRAGANGSHEFHAGPTDRTKATGETPPRESKGADPKGLPNPIEAGLKVLLQTCFKPGEYVGISDTNRNEAGEHKPGKGTTLTQESWIERLNEKPISTIYTSKDGLFFRINPMKKGGKSDGDVTIFRHALVEFDLDQNGDDIPKEIQYGLLIASGMPISAVLDSGNKSIHALVRVDASDRQEYNRRVEIICQYFRAHNFDPKNKNPSRYSRCPGVSRNLYDKDGKLVGVGRQELLAINLGAASWDEWEKAQTPPKVYIEFLKPSEIKAYQPAPGVLLVGDNHIVRGNVTVLGGAPGVGKSRAAVGLGEAGATQFEWFGLKVHCQFQTLIIQNENGRYRLSQEFANLDADLLDPYLRVTPPPPFGLCFNKAEFRDQLKRQLESEMPGVAILDPWNAVSSDDKQRDYIESFELIRSVFPSGDEGPAIVIVAHTRKPIAGERANGRALMALLAGSYVLASIPRTVFILQSASDDVTDNRVVVTCCKNNDGQLGERSVWVRDNGLWSRSPGFNWDEWDSAASKGGNGVRGAITAQAMRYVFDDGRKSLTCAEAVKALMELLGMGHTACYKALKIKGGKFGQNLSYDKKTKLFSWHN